MLWNNLRFFCRKAASFNACLQQLWLRSLIIRATAPLTTTWVVLKSAFQSHLIKLVGGCVLRAKRLQQEGKGKVSTARMALVEGCDDICISAEIKVPFFVETFI